MLLGEIGSWVFFLVGENFTWLSTVEELGLSSSIILEEKLFIIILIIRIRMSSHKMILRLRTMYNENIFTSYSFLFLLHAIDLFPGQLSHLI